MTGEGQLGPILLGVSGSLWITSESAHLRGVRAGVFIHHFLSVIGGELILGALNSLAFWPAPAVEEGLGQSCRYHQFYAGVGGIREEHQL